MQHDEFEKICKKNNLQLFVFQYDNINDQITMITIISNKKNEVIKILFKYPNYTTVFDEIDANKFFDHKSYNYAIETKSKIFSFESIYIVFITKFKAFKNHFNDILNKEFIVFFWSSANAFIMFVKKNDDLRLCVDYKDLNFITVKNRYFILSIKQLLNRLIKTVIFTRINIRLTHNALRIRTDDK